MITSRVRLIGFMFAALPLLAVACGTAPDEDGEAVAVPDSDEEAPSQEDSEDPGEAEADEVIEILLALPSFSLGHGLTLVAHDAGFFEQNGLDVELLNLESPDGAMTAVLSGSAQAWAAPPAAGFSAMDRADIHMPVVAYTGPGSHIALSNEAIEASGLDTDASVEDRIRALDGLTIGTGPGGSVLTQHFNHVVSTVDGVEPETVEMGQAEYMAALTAGAIDGFVASSPFPMVAEAEGIGQTWLSGPRGDYPGYSDDHIYVLMGFTSDFASENPEAAKRLIRAYNDASDFIANEPDLAGDAIRPRFGEIDDDVWDAVWEAERRVFVAVTPSTSAMEEAWAQFLTLTGGDDETPDLERIIAADLTREALGNG